MISGPDNSADTGCGIGGAAKGGIRAFVMVGMLVAADTGSATTLPEAQIQSRWMSTEASTSKDSLIAPAEPLGSATTEDLNLAAMRLQLDCALRLVRLAEFESEEMDTTPAIAAFQELIDAAGVPALEMIEMRMRAGSVDRIAAFDILRLIGELRMPDPMVRQETMEFLVRSLGYRSTIIREGALLGLASLDDPKSLRAVREARARERSPVVARTMDKLIEQLSSCNK
jgi:hypothetical protein